MTSFQLKGDFHESSSQTTLKEQLEDPLPVDFYEIEDVLQRRLCKDSLMNEYKTRFKGYQSDDDVAPRFLF